MRLSFWHYFSGGWVTGSDQKVGDGSRWGAIFFHRGTPSPRKNPDCLKSYIWTVSAPERLKFLGVPACKCWMLVNVDQCGRSDNPGHKFGRIQNKMIIIGQNLKNHFPIRILKWNLAQSRRIWIDLHYWNNNFKKKSVSKWQPKQFFDIAQ